MFKRYLFLTIFACVLTVSTFAFDYWYLDVTVRNVVYGTSSVQRAYLFRDLETLEYATGFPRNENESGVWRNRWRWTRNPNYSRDSSHAQIFSVMRKEGLRAAFVLDASGRAIDGEAYYTYSVYLISDGFEYYGGATVYGRPIKIE